MSWVIRKWFEINLLRHRRELCVSAQPHVVANEMGMMATAWSKTAVSDIRHKPKFVAERPECAGYQTFMR